MKKPNFWDVAKQKLRKWHWPAWFPYPSSWFRALILLPIALPGTHLIVFGLTGLMISISQNRPVMLIFSILFGLLIPTISLAFIYHFIWFIWHDHHSHNNLYKLVPGFMSLWAGLYTTFVMAASFMLIVGMFSELAFLDCQLYEKVKYVTVCNGRLTERAIKLILSSIEGKNFFNKPWFIMWIFSAAYLYQLECLIKKVLVNQLKSFSRGKAKIPSVENQYLEIPAIQDNVGITPTKKNKKQQHLAIPKIQQYYQTHKPRNTKKLIIPLLFLISGGIYLFLKFPEMKNNLTFYISAQTQSTSTQIKPQIDIFQKAVNRAINAANLTQSAKSRQEWKKVVAQWQAAIALMESVPSSNPNYATARQQIIEYQQNLGYAKKNSTKLKHRKK
ncbi:hypothetical protein [Nostoc sp. TCL26-01]|uniref:hypothetical protein n=1 Tax=Nostoc sp. TCL26-01 TaxID=2576904 RepID=UPI0015C1AC38|nr:hypothetical protein [Nostoc sp. TCL26-01]QLE57657.1 hypothetical protein FD725_20335 [Nostoc sp. TCL26-01]